MKKRTTLILAGIVAVLAVFILVWEQHQVTSGETSEREGRLLPTFVRDRVRRLEITRGGKKIVLERPEPAEPGEMVDWRMKSPVDVAADDDAVDSVVGALEWLDARRTVGETSEADRRRFGLDRPRVRVSYTLSGGTTGTLIVGGPAEGEGVYVQAGDAIVHVVGQDLFEALDHDANHFRDKRIAEVRASKVKTIVLGGSAGERRLERRDGVWHLAGASGGRANTAQVEEMLRALESLDATRFVGTTSGNADLARYGLTPGRATARIEIDGSAAVTLRVGAPCEGHTDDEVYVVRDGSGIVACTAKSLLDTLGRTAESLRDRRLLTASAESTAWIEVRAGETRVKVVKGASGWRLEQPRNEEADEDAVEGFLRDLRGFEALGIEAATGPMPADARVVTVHLDANRDETFRCVAATTDAPTTPSANADAGVSAPAESRPTALCQRGNETSRLRMDAGVLELMAPLSLRFRAKRIVRDGSGDAVRIVVEGEGGRQQVENREGTWRLTAPIEAEADAMSVRSVVQRVATLTVVRFAAERRLPEHGLDTPRFTVSARFEGTARPDEEVRTDRGEDEHDDEPGDDAPSRDADAGPRPRERSYVIRIGAATDGGAFAELEGFPGVFVVSQGLVDEVRRPLVERSFLQIDREDVRSIVLVRGADRLELVREGDTWRGAGRTFAAERMDPLLDRISSLRASSAVRLGAALPSEGFAPPRASITVRRDGDAGTPEITFHIGAAFGPEGSREAYTRRDGIETTFALSDESARTFLDFDR